MDRDPFYSIPSSLVSKKLESASFYDVLFGKVDFGSGEFWVSINRWMMFVMILAIAMLVVNRVLIIKRKIPEYIADIFIYGGVLEGVVIYLLTPAVFAKYKFSYFFFSKTGIAFMVLIAYCITMLLICYFEFKKAKAYDNLVNPEEVKTADKLDEEAARKTTLMRVCVIGIFLFEVSLAFWLKPLKICLDYGKNYGSYEKEDHTERTDLEESYLGNYQNKSVVTDKGLFYIASSESAENKTGNCKLVKKMDSEGNITEVFRSDESHYAIAYYEGYLYLANWEEILKVNPDTGEAEQIIIPEPKQEFNDFCLIDDRIYVQCITSYEEIKRSKYDPDKIKSKIVYYKISGDKLSDPILYLDDVIEKIDYSFDGEVLSYYLINNGNHHGYKNISRQSSGQYYYKLEEQSLAPQGSVKVLAIYDSRTDIDKGGISDVGAFNVHNGAIYYVHLLENGFEICKCSMDGTASEVIDTYTDGTDYRCIDIDAFKIAITDNKILVNLKSAYATDNETRDMTWIPGMEYIVDLK